MLETTKTFLTSISLCKCSVLIFYKCLILMNPLKVGFCIEPLRGSLKGQPGNALRTLFLEKKFKG